MKTFLNVLYRRILYRIPLKFLLVLLAVCAVFIACFSSANLVLSSDWTYISINRGGNYTFNTTEGQVFCLTTSNWEATFTITYQNQTYEGLQKLYCFDGGSSVRVDNTYNGYNTIYIRNTNVPNSVFEMSSLECQTEYNLIPISSVDQNYCTTNNLCPSSECPTCPVCPVGSGGVSTLYINDILHVGSPFIYMNIPDEIDWDYAYTQGGTNMNIDVVGYNQDTEYINDVITVQNYKPNSSDFSSLISQAVPLFVPGLCIILLLYFIFRFIKKIF